MQFLNVLLKTKKYFCLHDWEIIEPNHYNIIYEHIQCNCGIILKSYAEMKQHYILTVPRCRLNRVCLKCEKVDKRLDKSILEIMKLIEEKHIDHVDRKILAQDIINRV